MMSLWCQYVSCHCWAQIIFWGWDLCITQSPNIEDIDISMYTTSIFLLGRKLARFVQTALIVWTEPTQYSPFLATTWVHGRSYWSHWDGTRLKCAVSVGLTIIFHDQQVQSSWSVLIILLLPPDDDTADDISGPLYEVDSTLSLWAAVLAGLVSERGQYQPPLCWHQGPWGQNEGGLNVWSLSPSLQYYYRVCLY